MKIRNLVSTISFKIIVPIIVIFIIVMSIAFARMNLMNKEFASIKSLEEINNIIMQINNKIEAAENAAVYSSSIYSDLSIIKSSYKKYKETGNLDSTNFSIKKSIISDIDNIERNLGLRPMVQMYGSPAILLYRSWSNEFGEDLSSSKENIFNTYQSHSSTKGVNIDETGLVIAGTSPVFINGDYLGCVETSFPFNIVIDRIIKDNKTDFALYVDRKSLKNRSLEMENLSGFSLVQSSEGYLTDNILQQDIKLGSKEVVYKSVGNYTYAIVSIFNHSGSKIGFVSVQINIKENLAAVNEQLIKNIIFSFIVIILVIIVVRWGIYRVVIRPIDTLAKDINIISKGRLIDNIKNNKIGIIGAIYNAYNVMLDRLRYTSEFANNIGEGNLDIDLSNISSEDVLGQSLIRMRDNLLEAKKLESENKIEADKRNWATKGFADFAEILRYNNSDIDTFSDNIIRNLVKYTDSNQGGLFVMNDNDPDNIFLELTASYAFDRKKFASKSIKLGEGLVGTCAIEKKTIFLTEVPDNYITITSGLGDANPRCILLIPLKLENEIFGVIELASFNIYEDYQINFIEKLGENIASTMSVTKTNILTKELLEQSQQQQEEMAAQEEEMRQNLEEMQATQEAMSDVQSTTELKAELAELQEINKKLRAELIKKEKELLARVNEVQV